MAITINGDGTLTGISTGGLPDGIVDADMLATSAVATAKIADDAVTVAKTSFTGDLQFNSGYGSAATAYGCRAWCSANLTGSGSISGSGNVTSLTDRGTGRWQLNFATAMPDDDYAAVCSSKGSWNLLATHIVTTSSVNVLAVNQSFAYLNPSFICSFINS